jgi:hypothetical protein
MFSLRFDMRAPAIGAFSADLYEAALDMCAWAETRGCIAAVVCEHHASPDGYLPTPLILSSAIAARTGRLAINADFLRTKRGPTSNALLNRSSQRRPLPLTSTRPEPRLIPK